MYTLRPVVSWQYFHHASALYQLHLKTTYGISESNIEAFGIPSQHLSATDRNLKRLEQSLYWSCFKSECEFRVELPFPQSELSLGEYPHLFPSPPTPNGAETNGSRHADSSFRRSPVGRGEPMLNPFGSFDALPRINNEDYGLRQHAKRLCNEEESWYYYLTEIALRRIGNRIVNTFFRQEPRFWFDIKPLLRMAQEFEAQVSSWSANLPPAMQHYETTSIIRAPHLNSRSKGAGSHVSRELSWAVDNRLVEMQTWLYQPFLYYLIHVGVNLPSSTPGHYSYYSPASGPSSRTGHISDLLNPLLAGRQTPISNNHRSSHVIHDRRGQSLDDQELSVLQSLIVSGIECNLKTLEVRSVGHRHHGLWFDLRSLMCASLILLAVVKSGNAAWIPGGVEDLWGTGFGVGRVAEPAPIGGKIGNVLAQFSFWASEAPDLLQYKTTLEELVREIRGS